MGIALDKINKINIVTFDWKEGKIPDIGIIAEDLEKILPEAIWHKDNRVEGIKILTLLAVTIKAIQELQEK